MSEQTTNVEAIGGLYEMPLFVAVRFAAHDQADAFRIGREIMDDMRKRYGVFESIPTSPALARERRQTHD